MLDRYLIRKFLSTAGFSLLICTMISCAIDFSDKVQSIIEEPCTGKDILAYYTGFVFQMSSLLMPLYTLIAVVFFTSRLAFNSEILSILNAGVSFGRLLRPYLIGGAIIGLLHLSINHFIAPGFNKWKLWFERTYVWKQQDKGKTTNVHLLTAPDVKVFIRGYNKNGKSMSGLRVERFEGSQIKSILSAENARWKSEPDRWELTKVTIRTFNGT